LTSGRLFRTVVCAKIKALIALLTKDNTVEVAIKKFASYMATNVPFMIMSNNFSIKNILSLFGSNALVHVFSSIVSICKKPMYTITVYETLNTSNHKHNTNSTSNKIYSNLKLYISNNTKHTKHIQPEICDRLDTIDTIDNSQDIKQLSTASTEYDYMLMKDVPVYTVDSVIHNNDVEITHTFNETNNYFTISSNQQEHVTNFMNMIIDYKADDKYIGNIIYVFSAYNASCATLRLNNPKSFDNIFLKEKDKKFIIDKIDIFLRSEQLYKEKCMPYKIGFILYGNEFGTGKSSTHYALSKYFKLPIYFLSADGNLSGQVDTIPPRSIIVIEEIDLYSIYTIANSSGSTISDYDEDGNSRLLDMLILLDGTAYLYGCIVIITTNNIDKIDPRILRPGRIDHRIEYTKCDLHQINCILKYYCDSENVLSDEIKQKLIGNISPATLVNQYILSTVGNIDQLIADITQYITSIESVNNSTKPTDNNNTDNNNNNTDNNNTNIDKSIDTNIDKSIDTNNNVVKDTVDEDSEDIDSDSLIYHQCTNET